MKSPLEIKKFLLFTYFYSGSQPPSGEISSLSKVHPRSLLSKSRDETSTNSY